MVNFQPLFTHSSKIAWVGNVVDASFQITWVHRLPLVVIFLVVREPISVLLRLHLLKIDCDTYENV